MGLWAKIDVEMPTDSKLYGTPVVTRHLWTCLICLAKKQYEGGVIRGYDAALLAGQFNLPKAGVVVALTYFQAQDMLEELDDGSLKLIHFEERQGAADTDAERSARYYERHRDEILDKKRAARSRPNEVSTASPRLSDGSSRSRSHGSPREVSPLDVDLEKELQKKDQKVPAQLAEKPPPAPPSEFVLFVRTEWPDFDDPADFETRAREAFPGIEPLAEARKARGWECASPRHKKHKHGQFLWNWLTTAQEKAGRNGSRGAPQLCPPNLRVDNDALNAEPNGRKML